MAALHLDSQLILGVTYLAPLAALVLAAPMLVALLNRRSRRWAIVAEVAVLVPVLLLTASTSGLDIDVEFYVLAWMAALPVVVICLSIGYARWAFGGREEALNV